jgi:hypothetical protein
VASVRYVETLLFGVKGQRSGDTRFAGIGVVRRSSVRGPASSQADQFPKKSRDEQIWCAKQNRLIEISQSY